MMDLVDLSSVAVRPSVEAEKGELTFVPFVNYLMTSLVRSAPAEITAELGQGETVDWQMTDLETGEKWVLCTIPNRHFRSVLGAIGTGNDS